MRRWQPQSHTSKCSNVLAPLNPEFERTPLNFSKQVQFPSPPKYAPMPWPLYFLFLLLRMFFPHIFSQFTYSVTSFKYFLKYNFFQWGLLFQSLKKFQESWCPLSSLLSYCMFILFPVYCLFLIFRIFVCSSIHNSAQLKLDEIINEWSAVSMLRGWVKRRQKCIHRFVNKGVTVNFGKLEG